MTIVRFMIGFLYWVIGKPFLNRNLTTFVFHEVHNEPRQHARDTRTFSDLETFEKQIRMIKSSFSPIDLKKSNDRQFQAGCIVSFDDGYVGVLQKALPILEKYQIPAVCFINMATVEGGINSSALAMYVAKQKHEEVDWRNSRPRFFDETLGRMNPDELQKIKDYQGPYLDVNELNVLARNSLITIGNHLYNHWLMSELSLEETDREITLNKQRLEKFESYRNYFATPHGVVSERTLDQLLKYDFRTVFSGKTILQESAQNVYPRIDLNVRISNKYQFFGAVAITKIRLQYNSVLSKRKHLKGSR